MERNKPSFNPLCTGTVQSESGSSGQRAISFPCAPTSLPLLLRAKDREVRTEARVSWGVNRHRTSAKKAVLGLGALAAIPPKALSSQQHWSIRYPETPGGFALDLCWLFSVGRNSSWDKDALVFFSAPILAHHESFTVSSSRSPAECKLNRLPSVVRAGEGSLPLHPSSQTAVSCILLSDMVSGLLLKLQQATLSCSPEGLWRMFLDHVFKAHLLKPLELPWGNSVK